MRFWLSYVMFALGLAGLAYGAPPATAPAVKREVTQQEAFTIAHSKLMPKLESRAKPGEEPSYVVRETERELVGEVVKETAREIAGITGDKSGAVDMALSAVAELEPIRNPCVLHGEGAKPQSTFPVSDPEVRKENQEEHKFPEVVGQICEDGEKNLASLFSPEFVSAIQNDVMKPGPNTGEEKPKGPNIGQQGPLDPARPDPLTGRPDPIGTPALNPTSNAPVVGMGGAPSLGPSMGGSGPQLSFADSGVHRGVAPSPGRAGASAPRTSSGDENVEAVRQALDWKVANREMEPAVAQKILDRITPALRSEPDFGTALQKATMELEQPKEVPKSIATQKPAPSFPKQATAGIAKAKPESSTLEPLAKPVVAADAGWLGLQNWTSPLPNPGLQEPTKKNLGDGLANSLTAAIAKKNELQNADGAASGDESGGSVSGTSGTSSAVPTSVESLQASGLFGSSTPTGKNRVSGEKVNLGSFLQRMARAIGVETTSGTWRKPASDSKEAEFERFENSAALALASVAPESFHPHIPQLVNMLFFLVPFTVVLVAFALWHWHRRRRES